MLVVYAYPRAIGGFAAPSSAPYTLGVMPVVGQLPSPLEGLWTGGQRSTAHAGTG